MKKIAVFPGSFDPFTKGHEDIVLRGTHFFDEVIVGIGNNTQKSRTFSVEHMKQLIEECFNGNPKVGVAVYTGLTSHFAKQVGACAILRGLRNTTDFEYENTIAQVNKYLNEDLETVFLITSPSLAYISSSIVRELYKFGTDVSSFLPYKLPQS
ncbi:MAG TPA: pantetheine-phosphate adenylyltransferase [Cytophagales bacterium]|nr:pantetheine-phosphate adenylyltransferase [Cytophagales bacterium]